MRYKEALAPSDLKLTARYSHLSSEAMREVQVRIARLVRTDPPERIDEGYHRGYQAGSGGHSLITRAATVTTEKSLCGR